MPYNSKDTPDADSPSTSDGPNASKTTIMEPTVRRAKLSANEERIKILETKVENLSKQLRETTKSRTKTPKKSIKGQDNMGDRVKGLWFTESRPPFHKKRNDARRYKGKEVWWCGTMTKGQCDAWEYQKPSECPHSNEPTRTNTLKKPSTKRKATSANTVELPNSKVCHSPHKIVRKEQI